MNHPITQSASAALNGDTPPQQQQQQRPGTQWYPTDAEYGFEDGDGTMLDENDHDLDQEGADGRDHKRRRIARACDMCRRKKIKCDGKMPKCGHCENYKTECIFTQVEKKRAPPKGAKYIEGLENRLARMESLLRLTGVVTEEDGGRTDLATLEKRLEERQSAGVKSAESSPASPHGFVPLAPRHALSNGAARPVAAMAATSPDGSNKASVNALESDGSHSFRKEAKEVDALADQMCSLITNNYGETRYIGSSSGFSIFSPKGIQWVNDKTGDASFQQMIAQATTSKQGFDHWKPEIFNDLFGRRVYKPLPGRQECFALLKDYFEHFNRMFPLFHEPTFMHLVDRQYSSEPYEGSGWWASLNVALGVAHRLRVMSNVVGQEEDEHAWGYLKNAMAVVSELTMRNTDLLSVQALLGMALFLQGTPNPQPSFFLTAAAVRLSHSIGLHKRGSDFNLSDVENEQRKRVFWIAYLLDKDICLRSGRPPSQDDDDMNVELPSEDPPDNVGNIPLTKEDESGRKTMNLFRLMCTFAQIQSRVYKQLYSVRASRQSDGELLNTIGELDAQLEEWKDQIPVDFRPEHEIHAAHTPLILHVVVLHFAYYNCLTTIHRMSVHHGYWTSRLSDYALQGLNARPLNPRVFMSAALCVNAARTSIELIRYIPQGDYACVWLILYYPVSALVTLFANILQNPQDVRARSDTKLMASVVKFLTLLERDLPEASGYVHGMLSVCSEFERIARVVLDKAERDIRSRGKRKAAGLGAPTERERERMQRNRTPADVEMERNLQEGKTLEQMQVETQASYRRPVQTPSLRASIAGSQAGSAGPFSPNTIANILDPLGVANNHNHNSSSAAATAFQQPFVPQDLWQMPMTLEWDWAEGLGIGLGNFTPGPAVMFDNTFSMMNGNGNVTGDGGGGAPSAPVNGMDVSSASGAGGGGGGHG
nr:putative transcriptional regulatory protein [Quercus suber]